MSAGVVHFAGIDVRVGDLLRQRCGWCGALLIDYDLATVAVPLGQDPMPATWACGALVLVDGGLSTTVTHEDGASLPEGACGALDPEVTR